MEELGVIIVKPGFSHLKGSLKSLIKSSLKVLFLEEVQVQLNEQQVREFYQEHVNKTWFKEHLAYMTSEASIFIKFQGSVADMRKMIGSTNPAEAETGSLRHLFGIDTQRNVVHCSDSIESALREIEFMSKLLKEI